MAGKISFFPKKVSELYISWLIRASLAEAVATGFFTLAGCASVVISSGFPDSTRLIFIALVHGLSIMILVSSICGLTGGHINPVVSLVFVFTGRMDAITGSCYIISQLCGGILGVGILKALTGSKIEGLGAHNLSVSVGEGLVVEMLLTALLIFVIWGTAVDPKGPTVLAPLCIGVAVLLDHLIGVHITGASMNPARSFAPAIWANQWKNHWVYWVGPILGGLLAGGIYNSVFLYAHRPCSQAPENLLEEENCQKDDLIGELKA